MMCPRYFGGHLMSVSMQLGKSRPGVRPPDSGQKSLDLADRMIGDLAGTPRRWNIKPIRPFSLADPINE